MSWHNSISMPWAERQNNYIVCERSVSFHNFHIENAQDELFAVAGAYYFFPSLDCNATNERTCNIGTYYKTNTACTWRWSYMIEWRVHELVYFTEGKRGKDTKIINKDKKTNIKITRININSALFVHQDFQFIRNELMFNVSVPLCRYCHRVLAYLRFDVW